MGPKNQKNKEKIKEEELSGLEKVYNEKKNENTNPIINFIEENKVRLVEKSKILNENNIQFYLIYFFLFFFLYFTITAKYINSSFEDLFNKNKNDKWFLIGYYGGLGLLLIIWIIYFFICRKSLQEKSVRLKIILFGIFVIFLFCNFGQVFFKYISIYLPDVLLRILLGLFLLFNIIFFIFYVTLFLININEPYNLEVYIAIELLILFYVINSANNVFNKSNVYNTLTKHDFNYEMLNCFKRLPNEGYDNSNSMNNLPYIEKLFKEKGNNYLEFKYNIPIKYRNSKSGKMEDLRLCDFYYPGSYKSYLGDTPLNGTPDEEALVKALTYYKVRIVTLDIYSSIDDEFSNDAEPVVRCEDMKEGAKPLNLNKCFEIINEHAWMPNNNNEMAYPFFLILEFHFDDKNNILYEKIRNSIVTNFRRYLMSHYYDFNGHNGKDFINLAKMEDCIGKIIIITNKYPVGVLNELVNCSIGKEEPNNTNNSITLNLYTSDMVKFEGTGVSQKESKTELTNHCKTKINFYHTEPNKNYKNKEQAKSGLYNPKFQDIAQYGAQSTLMYLYLTDPNLNKWYLYFQKKSNFDPVLKDEELRDTVIQESKVKPQESIKGIGGTQKYCTMEDNDGNCYMETEKSNIGNGKENKSFNKK